MPSSATKAATRPARPGTGRSSQGVYAINVALFVVITGNTCTDVHPGRPGFERWLAGSANSTMDGFQPVVVGVTSPTGGGDEQPPWPSQPEKITLTCPVVRCSSPPRYQSSGPIAVRGVARA